MTDLDSRTVQDSPVKLVEVTNFAFTDSRDCILVNNERRLTGPRESFIDGDTMQIWFRKIFREIKSLEAQNIIFPKDVIPLSVLAPETKWEVFEEASWVDPQWVGRPTPWGRNGSNAPPSSYDDQIPAPTPNFGQANPWPAPKITNPPGAAAFDAQVTSYPISKANPWYPYFNPDGSGNSWIPPPPLAIGNWPLTDFADRNLLDIPLLAFAYYTGPFKMPRRLRERIILGFTEPYLCLWSPPYSAEGGRQGCWITTLTFNQTAGAAGLGGLPIAEGATISQDVTGGIASGTTLTEITAGSTSVEVCYDPFDGGNFQFAVDPAPVKVSDGGGGGGDWTTVIDVSDPATGAPVAGGESWFSFLTTPWQIQMALLHPMETPATGCPGALGCSVGCSTLNGIASSASGNDIYHGSDPTFGYVRPDFVQPLTMKYLILPAQLFASPITPVALINTVFLGQTFGPPVVLPSGNTARQTILYQMISWIEQLGLQFPQEDIVCEVFEAAREIRQTSTQDTVQSSLFSIPIRSSAQYLESVSGMLSSGVLWQKEYRPLKPSMDRITLKFRTYRGTSINLERALRGSSFAASELPPFENNLFDVAGGPVGIILPQIIQYPSWEPTQEYSPVAGDNYPITEPNYVTRKNPSIRSISIIFKIVTIQQENPVSTDLISFNMSTETHSDWNSGRQNVRIPANLAFNVDSLPTELQMAPGQLLAGNADQYHDGI